MAISMYEAAIPVLLRTLTNMVAILEKGAAYGESHGIEPSVLIQSRLFPDMFPLVRQVQIVSDISRRGVARLAGLEAPAMEDSESSFSELIDRLHASIGYLQTFEAASLDGTEEREVTVPVGGGKSITMSGWPFLSCFVLPNVYFHATTAYDILRHNGVPLGKMDFLGKP